VIPWRGRVDAPALMRSERQAPLFSAEPGRLISMVAQNARVTEGQIIYRLESIEIAHSVAAARAQLDQAQADQTAGTFNPDRRRDQQTIFAKAAEAAAALAHAETRAENLEFRAPFAGEVKDIPAGLQIGDHVRRLERLGVLVSATTSVVEAYVAEADLDRVVPGAHARFIPVDGPSFNLVVSEIASTSTRSLEVAELASIYEGPIAVRRPDASSGLIPEAAIYRVLLTGESPLPASASRIAGEVVIDAPARSALMTVYRRAAAVLLREATP